MDPTHLHESAEHRSRTSRGVIEWQSEKKARLCRALLFLRRGTMNQNPLWHEPKSFRVPNCRPDFPFVAIGDVHGHASQLKEAIVFAEQQLAEGRAERITFLGDLTDEGPKSAECLEILAACRQRHPGAVDLLGGNHEQFMFVAMYHASAATRRRAFFNWSRCHGPVRFGDEVGLERHKQLIERLGLGPENWRSHVSNGNVLCVHAGVPAKATSDEVDAFLRQPFLELPAGEGRTFSHWCWIRDDFLEYEEPLDGQFIIHGHSPHDYIAEPRKGRLNIDGGAKKTGKIAAALVEAGVITLNVFVPPRLFDDVTVEQQSLQL